MKNLALSLVLTATLLPLACQSTAPDSRHPAPALAGETSEQLAGALREFAGDFRTTIENAASHAGQLDLTRAQRKAVTTWRVQAGTLLRHAFDQDDPREILLDVWSLCQRMSDYLEHGPGVAELGPACPTALAAARVLLERTTELAQAYVSPEALAQIRARVDEYAHANPLQAGLVAPPTKDLSDIDPGQQVLNWILNVPLAPLRSVETINQTSDAMRDMSRTAERFTDIMSDLPAATRREALLLAEDLEQLPSVAATTQSVQQMAASTERFTQVVDDLPHRTREEAEQLLDRVDESHPQTRATLAEAQKTADAIRATATELRELTAALDRTLAQFSEAGRAWTITADSVRAASRELAVLRGPAAQRAGGEGGAERSPGTAGAPSAGGASDAPLTTQPGFRFEDVTASAEALTRTATELRGLVGDLHQVLASGTVSGEADKLSQPAAEVLDRAGLISRGTIDHAAWRVAQLLVLLVVLLVAYRWLTRTRSQGNSRASGAPDSQSACARQPDTKSR